MLLHTVIFIGRSGCGKGTQAALLKDVIHKRDPEKNQIVHIETGDRFRGFIQSDSYSAALSEEASRVGRRQPDFLACYMWADTLITELGENMHLFFDGSPRSVTEAKLLATALEFYKRESPIIINLEVSRKWSEEKLLARGRVDDKTLADIDKRLDWFDTDVMPTIEFFRNNPYYKVLDINGMQSIEDVHDEIMEKYYAD
ncbi:nucleoside monophosphate kinase [Candidatus Parcubacteria bacterium]|nr:nucleoside monophosphate kinase [Candidatus Parcubacteria bacterium]